MNCLLPRLSFVALTVTALVSAPAQAATNIPQWTLADAKRIAFERNWDLLAARAGVDAAKAQLLMAKEFPNPNLSASSVKIGNYDNSTPAGNGIWARSYDTIFAINQLFEIGGKRCDRQEAARQNVFGATARFFDAKRTLEQGVTKAYVSSLLANENEKILGESAGYMRHEQDIAEARWKAGDLAESDLKQIQVAAEQYALQVNAAHVAATQACIAVEILLGLNQPKGDWLAADSLQQVSNDISTNLISATSGLRPDVFAAQTDLRSTEANLKLQKAYRIPDPTVSLQYEHNPPGGGPAANTVGFGISFPLPIWNQNKGAIHAAQAAVEQSRIAMEKLRAQAIGDLVNARAAFDEAYGRLQRYRGQIAPKSASARESVTFKFNKGGATLVDLLEAERTDNDVRVAAAQAMADTASSAADLVAAQTTRTETELNPVR